MGERYVRILGWHGRLRALVLGSRKSFEDGGDLWGGRENRERKGTACVEKLGLRGVGDREGEILRGSKRLGGVGV